MTIVAYTRRFQILMRQLCAWTKALSTFRENREPLLISQDCGLIALNYLIPIGTPSGVREGINSLRTLLISYCLVGIFPEQLHINPVIRQRYSRRGLVIHRRNIAAGLHNRQ